MSKPILTQERLKELLSYDPETGVFVWVARPSTRIKIGDPAGYFRPDGYHQIKINGAMFISHRLAWLYMTGAFPPDQIDHIDRNPANNRFANLRAVTNSENMHNLGKYKNNKSGFKGVCYHKQQKKWVAQIQLNSVNKYLGRFSTPEEASAAYLAAQRIYHPTCPI
jgi:hypothetical protein